ncbi:Two-component response regulator-like APRR9 [Hirschfeldia incana]|nr:Two-component response regulator-like APRR9 [Hirschfeldia incana]
MMSSQDSMKMVLKCMLRGAADYLIKPMRKNELKNLWQHVWRRLSLRGGDHTANGPSLPVSQQNLEDADDTCADSRYHSDHGSGSQAISDNGDDKMMGNVKPLAESFDVTMDLIGGIDTQLECYYGDNTREQHVGPELGLSLKRSCSGGSLEKNQDESKHQKLSLSDASAFSRYENGKPEEKAVVAVVEESRSGEPKTPSESHEKMLRCDHGSATTSSNHENVGSSSVTGQNQFLQSGTTKQKQEYAFPVESNSLKEVEVGCQSTNNEGTVTAGGQSRSSTREKAKEKEEEEEGEGGGVTAQQRRSEREAALMKFRMKRRDRCFGKKVRYESRKKLAEQRPRVKGQFVRAVNSSDASSTK